MTPLAKIEAAIVELELLRNHSTGGNWYSDELIYPTPEFDSGLFNGRTRVALANFGDASAIAVLHRTIDAQLAILRYARGGERDWADGGSPDEPAGTVVARALANAILGDPA